MKNDEIRKLNLAFKANSNYFDSLIIRTKGGFARLSGNSKLLVKFHQNAFHLRISTGILKILSKMFK